MTNSAGIYNVLKSTAKAKMPVHEFLAAFNKSDECIGANLSTIFKSIRGTKQYWFHRSSELKCMLREWGSPTLFITLSCAEYDSEHIVRYLRKFNHDQPAKSSHRTHKSNVSNLKSLVSNSLICCCVVHYSLTSKLSADCPSRFICLK